jgi:hypothetical protein
MPAISFAVPMSSIEFCPQLGLYATRRIHNAPFNP